MPAKKAKKAKAVPRKRTAQASGSLSHQGRELVHGDMLTVAWKGGPFPGLIRAACEEAGRSAAKVLGEAFLLWRQRVDKGMVPGAVYDEYVAGVKGKARGKAKAKKKKKKKAS